MKSIAAITAVLAAGFLSIAAQASTVTIDFEEVTPVSGMAPVGVDSKGYSFYASTSFGNPPDIGVNSAGIYALAENNFGFCETCGAYITMERTDGGSFAILALESYSFVSGVFSGTVTGGGAASLGVPVGTGDWLNLESMMFSEFTTFSDNYVQLDDIVVNAVPIPAAFWLFGSALAGLGWFRRRQS